MYIYIYTYAYILRIKNVGLLVSGIVSVRIVPHDKSRMVRCLDDDLPVLPQELPVDGFLDALGGPREPLLVQPDLAVPALVVPGSDVLVEDPKGEDHVFQGRYVPKVKVLVPDWIQIVLLGRADLVPVVLVQKVVVLFQFQLDVGIGFSDEILVGQVCCLDESYLENAHGGGSEKRNYLVFLLLLLVVRELLVVVLLLLSSRRK